jgi:hypothetical protein
LSETLLSGSLPKLFEVIMAALCMLRKKIEARQSQQIWDDVSARVRNTAEGTRKCGPSARGKSKEASIDLLEKGLSTVAQKAIRGSIENSG